MASLNFDNYEDAFKRTTNITLPEFTKATDMHGPALGVIPVLTPIQSDLSRRTFVFSQSISLSTVELSLHLNYFVFTISLNNLTYIAYSINLSKSSQVETFKLFPNP